MGEAGLIDIRSVGRFTRWFRAMYGASIFALSHSPFPDILPYLRTFLARFRTLSDDIRNYTPIRAVPSCLPLSRAVCLKKIAPPIGWDGRGDLVENDGVPCLTVIERQDDGFWKEAFSNKSVAGSNPISDAGSTGERRSGTPLTRYVYRIAQ